jgi:hypothetical protein
MAVMNAILVSGLKREEWLKSVKGRHTSLSKEFYQKSSEVISQWQ